MNAQAIPKPLCNTVTAIENYLNRFVSFADNTYSLPIALWILGTYIWPELDVYPYLVITSATKRSGKTRLAEMISFTCNNPVPSGALTPAAIYKTMAEERPTLFFDEAETLNSEAANVMRSVLNMGYRKGQVIRRVIGSETRSYETYCPKVFILIGDVYDTLKDRSIIIPMQRGETKERFTFEVAKADGNELRHSIVEEIINMGGAPQAPERTSQVAAWTYSLPPKIADLLAGSDGVDFLTDRDEEIWTPLFVLCKAFCPDRYEELSRIAVDMATEKTQEAQSFRNLKGMEEEAQKKEYAFRLLADLNTIMVGHRAMATQDIVEKLRAIPTAPWRKFRGEGLTGHNLADLLRRYGVRHKVFRSGRKTYRGYLADQVKAAIKKYHPNLEA